MIEKKTETKPRLLKRTEYRGDVDPRYGEKDAHREAAEIERRVYRREVEQRAAPAMSALARELCRDDRYENAVRREEDDTRDVVSNDNLAIS